MAKDSHKKCQCGNRANRKIYCSNCSDVRMAILLKNGNDHLKYENNRSQKSNPIWYSILSQNGNGPKKIITGMLRRFSAYKDRELVGATNIIRFYDNKTNQLLFSFRP